MNIKKAIMQNKAICMYAYSVNDKIEKRLHYILELILNQYNCPALLTPIYTSVKELLINAVKANYKNIYFEDYAPKNKSDEIINYDLALKLFKLELSRENAVYFEQLARRYNYKAKVEFKIQSKNLFITISNPVAMTARELNKVNQKINDANQCNDITEYFLKTNDDPENEGAGLGLVLITMMIKSLGASQENFSIRSENNITTASLIIPLSPSSIEHLL